MSKLQTKSDLLITLPPELSPDNIAEFKNSVERCVNRHCHEVRIDCSNVSRVGSNHVGLIWQMADFCREAGVNFYLEGVTPGLKKTLKMLDLADQFNVSSESQNFKELKDSRPVSISGETNFDFKFSLSEKGIHEVIQKFILYLRSMNLPKKAEYTVRSVFYEVVINLRDHSGLSETDHARVSATADGGGITMVFEDDGRAFDPTTFSGTQAPNEAAKNRQKRGFGILMITKLVDDIAYSRKNGQTNSLKLYKQWSD